KAQYFDEGGGHREMALADASLGLAPNLLDAGMTLCISDYHALSPAVGELAGALGKAFGVPAAFDVAWYVSGPGRGFGMHFDDVPIFVLQCQGSKRWLHGETPAVARPVGSVDATDHRSISDYVRRFPGLRLDIPNERELCDHVLRPDDLL